MEVARCGRDVGGHTSSLLTGLNLQRERAQFCDCVVRQKQSPGQLYPAHRCVLAASSPVLESVLSCSGALVELQAPCLSGSVLALLLDYIYTGALPCTCTQQQYYSLLSAACYLQMDKLQVALCAWQQTEGNNTGKANILRENENENMTSSHSNTADTLNKHLPLTCSDNVCEKLEERDACSLQTPAGSLERHKAATYADARMHSASLDPCIKEAERDACGARSTTDANRRGRKDAPALNGSATSSMSESGGSANNSRQASHSTLQHISNITEGYSVSGVHKDMQKDQFHPAGTIKPDTWQNNADEEMEGTDEGTRSSSLPSASSSSPYPCCGAVPVICHSGRASMLQQVSTVPAYPAVSQVSVNCSRAAASRSASAESQRIIESITTEHEEHPELEDLGHRHNKDQTGTEDLDSKDRSDQCASQNLLYKCRRDRSDTIIKESALSNTDHFVKLDDDDVLKCAAAEERTADVSLPVETSGMGSDSYCKDSCSKGEAKEEHSYCGKCPAEMQTQDSHCNLFGPEASWYHRLQRAEASTKDVLSSQRDYESNSKGTATEDKRHSEVVCPPRSNATGSVLENVTGGRSQRGTSLVLEQISDTENSEPGFTFAIPANNDLSDPLCRAVGQSFHGHVHYHCMSHGDSSHKHSHPSYHKHSDQSSEEEESFANPANSPLGHHFAMGNTDRFLLLDISTKHAELLVSYEHRTDPDKKGSANSDSGTGIWNSDGEQRNEVTSVAGVEVGIVGARMKLGAECFDEFGNKSWFRETNIEERTCVGREQIRSRAQVKNKAGVMEEASKHEEGENQTSTLRVSSAPSVPESVQTSMSSTLSICIPSTLPASLPTNISAHLSTPVHHAFQCSLCDRSFSQRGSLNRHVRSHLGVRPFPCPRCPMTFSRQYRVTEHMRVHQRCTLGSEFPHPPASSI